MKGRQSQKQLTSAIWLLVIVPVGALLMWSGHQETNDVGVAEQWLRTLPVSLLISLGMFAALRGLIRKHGEPQVRGAADRAARIIGPLALIGLLVLFLGLPLFFLWLGGGLWGGH